MKTVFLSSAAVTRPLLQVVTGANISRISIPHTKVTTGPTIPAGTSTPPDSNMIEELTEFHRVAAERRCNNSSKGVQMARPLCSHTAIARYKASSYTNVDLNFTCAAENTKVRE